MSEVALIAIVLRFRDFGNEQSGAIAEHRKVLRQQGHVWWSWWRRQAENVPRRVLGDLFVGTPPTAVPILLFDSGVLRLYSTFATGVAIAPSSLGINAPELDATPEYCARGRHQLWFRLEQDITPLNIAMLDIVAKPTMGHEADQLPRPVVGLQNMSLEALRDDRPTFWLSQIVTSSGTLMS